MAKLTLSLFDIILCSMSTKTTDIGYILKKIVKLNLPITYSIHLNNILECSTIHN